MQQQKTEGRSRIGLMVMAFFSNSIQGPSAAQYWEYKHAITSALSKGILYSKKDAASYPIARVREG
jgi:hypothetical protein